MTVKTQLEKTILTAQDLCSQLKYHALETEVPAVVEMYERMHQQVEDIIPRLKGRLAHVKDEEPQFR
ncbi:MAG: DUF1657 domain-containing protein [Firmicutes bacterium]|nr:DUF1657 domain-containing protein [Bacillota bacterium]